MTPVSVIYGWSVWTDPESKPSRGGAKSRSERVGKKMEMGYMAKGSTFLIAGKRMF